MNKLLVVALLLTSCGGGNDARPLPTPNNLLNAADWEIGPIIAGKNYSHNVPLHPIQDVDGWHIDIPQSDGVHYVTRAYSSLANKSSITIKYKIEGKFVPSTAPQSPAIGPVIYFQRAGDNWSKDGGRWWATFNAPMPITAGSFTLTVPLNGPWTSVERETAISNPSDFAAAKAHVARIGFTLGGGTGFGHGVYAVGPARITVTDFTVQ